MTLPNDPDFLTMNYPEERSFMGDLENLSQHLEICRYRLGSHTLIGFWVAYFLAFHIRTTAMQMVLFLWLHRAVPDLHIIRMIFVDTGLGRIGLVNSALVKAGIISRNPSSVTLFRFCRGAGHGASLHAVHGHADLQHTDAHR